MRMTTEQIEQARDRDILQEAQQRGVRFPKSRRSGAAMEFVGPCPLCGGTDRFSINTRKQVFNCRQCRVGGNVIAFVQWIDGVTFTEAVLRLIGEDAGGATSRPAVDVEAIRRQIAEARAKAEAETVRRQQRARYWWQEAVPIWGTAAQVYLEDHRRLVLPADISPRVLRYHPACPFGEWPSVEPCLLALFTDVLTDQPTGIMRTALDGGAGKIGRKAAGQMGRSAIKLVADEDVGESLVIGEGLETCLSGYPLGLWPAWALGSADAIAKFPLIPGVGHLVIHCENDSSGTSARVVRECGNRWYAAGREVTLAEPVAGYKDLNDAVRGVKVGPKETAA
jgi:hypothetical protein